MPAVTRSQNVKPENLESPLLQSATSQLRIQLADSVTMFQSNVTLRSILATLSTNYDTSIWLDRRIDAEQLITAELSNATLAASLAQIAQISNSDICLIEDVVYVAPQGFGQKIESAYWTAFQRHKKWKSKLLMRHPACRWNRADSVEQILDAWEAKSSCELIHRDRLCHDQWNSGDLSTLSALAQLTVILAGFDLAPEFDEDFSRADIVEMPSIAEVSAIYPSHKIDLSVAKKWRGRWPDALAKKLDGDRFAIRAPIEAHYELLPTIPIRRVKNAASDLDSLRLTATLKGRLTDVLGSFQQQLNLTISPWPLEQSLGDRVIDLDVEMARLTEVLSRIGRASNTKINLNGRQISVFDDA
jgi:hypothetical protein